MAFENRYSVLDRTLHKLAFATWPAQIALSDIEERVFRTQLSGIEVKQPVFVTALPRAGTTLLLELCVSLGEFASHCYRDMPFVLIPMLWNRFTAGFRQSDAPRERAHGDGMLVTLDSPEAFEELVWKVFWRKHYMDDRIVPWKDEDDPEFSGFLHNHIRKIIALRHKQAGARYVSKNNLNIARLDVLSRIFPDAIFVIPFRQPLQHAASLLRQHLNFLEVHARDDFARDYMEAIGHYDFGENLRPIDFDGWLATARSQDPTTISFWLEYWIACYRHLLVQAGDHIHLLAYEAFCDQPLEGLGRLADILSIRCREEFLQQAPRIIATSPHPVDKAGIDRETLGQAEQLYAELLEASMV